MALFLQVGTQIWQIRRLRKRQCSDPQGDGWHRLRKRQMDTFQGGQIFVVGVKDVDRAVFRAGSAPRALFRVNVSRSLDQGDLEVSCFSVDPFDLRVSEDFDVGICRAFDEFGREDAHGTVVGWEGLYPVGPSYLPMAGPFSTRYTLKPPLAASQCDLDAAHGRPRPP